jgi:hypothetical protein
MYNSVTLSNSALKSLLFLVLFFIATPAHAGCASYATNGGTTDGYYLDNGCTAAINVYSPCEVVTNNTGNTLFVPSYYPGGSNGIGQNEWTSFITHAPAGVSVASCSCNLPWGGALGPGQSATAYANASEPCHGSCSAQTRTCDCSTTGLCVLSGNYTNQGCGVVACLPCNLPWGGQIQDGQSAYAYASYTVGCGGSCGGQYRSCDNGGLSGSYGAQSCSVDACPCNLPWGGQIGSGGSVTAYQEASATTCTSESRICSNGYLSGSYGYASCTEGGCSQYLCFTDPYTVMQEDCDAGVSYCDQDWAYQNAQGQWETWAYTYMSSTIDTTYDHATTCGCELEPWGGICSIPNVYHPDTETCQANNSAPQCGGSTFTCANQGSVEDENARGPNTWGCETSIGYTQCP